MSGRYCAILREPWDSPHSSKLKLEKLKIQRDRSQVNKIAVEICNPGKDMAIYLDRTSGRERAEGKRICSRTMEDYIKRGTS